MVTATSLSLCDYYRTIRPFYPAETSLRTDLPEWIALARRVRPRAVLDLGCGDGRLGIALRRDDPSRWIVGIDLLDALRDGAPTDPFARADMRALPFGPRFDLVAAANDPFAHLLTDEDRSRALSEARRVLRPHGRVVIDGLIVPAREGSTFVRVRDLPDGVRLTETWRTVGESIYETRYTYRRGLSTVGDATTRLRAWRPDEPALRERGAFLRGGLDGRPFDPDRARMVIVIEARA